MVNESIERFYPASPDAVYEALVVAARGKGSRAMRVRKTDAYTRVVSGRLRTGMLGTRGDVVCQVVPSDRGATIRITPHHMGSEFVTPHLAPRAEARRFEGLLDQVSKVLQK